MFGLLFGVIFSFSLFFLRNLVPFVEVNVFLFFSGN